MMKFTYRINTTLIGELIEETPTHYIFEANQDQYSWEKEITVVEEVEAAPKTKKDLVIAIQKIVIETNSMDSYFVRYFGAHKTVKQMLNNIDKDSLKGLLKKIQERAK